MAVNPPADRQVIVIPPEADTLDLINVETRIELNSQELEARFEECVGGPGSIDDEDTVTMPLEPVRLDELTPKAAIGERSPSLPQGAPVRSLADVVRLERLRGAKPF